MARNSSNSRRKYGKKSILSIILAVVLVFLYEAFQLLSGGSSTTTLQSETSVHFIDVGQGDATLIVSGGEAVLIDAGPASSRNQLVAYLKDIGVNKLRAAVATHPHEDHIGGMATILNTFPTDMLYMPNKSATTKTYEKMLDAIEENQVSVKIPNPNDTFSFSSGATLTFLYPDPQESYTDTNNYSIVSLFSAGDQRILLTGDAEAQAEEQLLQQGVSLRCNVLKVGHHGSSTSSTPAFLRAASPEIAVISCAKQNDYGHPHKETLQNLKQFGIETHITANEGSYVYHIPVQKGADTA